MFSAAEAPYSRNAYPSHNHLPILGDETVSGDQDIKTASRRGQPNRLCTIMVNLLELTLSREFSPAEQSDFDDSFPDQTMTSYLEGSLSSADVGDLNGLFLFFVI